MSDKPEKPQTVGELVAKTYLPKSVLSDIQIAQFQEIGKQYYEVMEQVKKIAEPIIDQMKLIHERPRLLPEMKDMFVINRPVEYEILEELREMNRNHKQIYASQESSNVIIYDTKSGSLDRTIGGKCFSYDLSENGMRKKLLDTLLDRGGYIKTKELGKIIGSIAVAKVVQTFNDYATNALRLKNVKVIKGKKGSGYRINPKVHIERV